MALPTDNKYLNRALASFKAGFTTQSGKKDAMADLNSVYGGMREAIAQLYLQVPHDQRTPDQESVYWDLPNDLHNWRPKHAALAVKVFPQMADTVAQIGALFELRGQMNAAEVTKAPTKAERQQEQVRVAAAGGSMNPALNDIVAQLNALKPEVAKEFRESITPQVLRLLEKWQGGEDMEAFHRNTKGQMKPLEAFIDFDGVYADRVAIGINEDKIEQESKVYAEQQVATLIHKLLRKIGNLNSVAVHKLRVGSMEFSMSGELNGRKVSIHQSRIINVSVNGTTFHQWPARIYVDDKLVSEDQYRGMGGGTEDDDTIKVGSKVKIAGRVVEVTAIRNAIARGVGPAVNGRHIEHVFWMEDGKERGYPKRYARLVPA